MLCRRCRRAHRELGGAHRESCMHVHACTQDGLADVTRSARAPVAIRAGPGGARVPQTARPRAPSGSHPHGAPCIDVRARTRARLTVIVFLSSRYDWTWTARGHVFAMPLHTGLSPTTSRPLVPSARAGNPRASSPMSAAAATSRVGAARAMARRGTTPRLGCREQRVLVYQACRIRLRGNLRKDPDA